MEKPTRQERKNLSQFIPLREDDTSNGNIRYGDFCWNPSWIHMGNKLEADIVSINETLQKIGIVAPVFLSPLATKKDDELPITSTKNGNEATASVAGSLHFQKRKPNHGVHFNEERDMFELSIDFPNLATEAEVHSKNKKGSANDVYAALVNKELGACLKQLVYCNYDKLCEQNEPAYIEKFSLKYSLFISSLFELMSNKPFDLYHTPGRLIFGAETLLIVWNLMDMGRSNLIDSTSPLYEYHKDKQEKFKENPLSIAIPHYLARHFLKPLIMLYSSKQQLVRARSNND